MNERLPEKGISVRTSCEHGAFSILVPVERGEDIIRHATMISSKHAVREIELAALIRDQIGGLAAEIEAAVAGSVPRFPEAEESIKSVIAIFTLGLLSRRADLAGLLTDHFRGERGLISVYLSEDTINVTIAGAGATWEASYIMGRVDEPVVTLQ